MNGNREKEFKIMVTVSYKCPNCGGDLRFHPAGQNYKCEFCDSQFTQEELEAMKPQGGEGDGDGSGETEAADGEIGRAHV